MSTDAQLNDLIRLKHPPSAPVERWQMLPTRQKAGMRQVVETASSASSPLRVRTTNVTVPSKTPDAHKLVIKYKKTPKIRSPKTPKHAPSSSLHYRTPGNSKRRTPPKSGRKKTPGRSPSGCRYIPNRAAMDLDYSAYLLRKKEGREEVDEEGVASPARQEYQQTLLKAISRSRGKSGQKGVLSFSVTTPSMAEGMEVDQFHTFQTQPCSLTLPLNKDICLGRRPGSESKCYIFCSHTCTCSTTSSF